MQIYTTAAAFLHRAQSFFEANETVHGSILGMTLRMRDKPEPAAEKPYLATFETNHGDLILAAAMKPGQNLVLAGAAHIPQSILDLLCADLATGGRAVAGVLAVDDLAQPFAETWQRASGQAYRLDMHMRAYEARQVIPHANPPGGSLRLAALTDLDLLVPWRAAFGMESLHEQPPENLRDLVAKQVEAGQVSLWEDGGPVSTAGCTRPTPRGIWIQAVYTPPECRGRGYASACVAELSRRMLDSGKTYVALYTDLDYPTSNRIYQKIGYRPVRDFMVFHFH
ncbi:MAG: GNAT family N-acetyltransferase [Chloroflexi bacterium]|nr:MAG: GNAT family N-acetyltransferase [Chloroflexota bacterium]